METAMAFKEGVSGNPHGNRHRTRHLLNQEFIYLKILGLLVPREHKVEHRNLIKELSDEELEAMIEYIKTSLAAQAGAPVKVIEGPAVGATASPALEPPKPNNRVMLEADTAVGPREHKPRKVPSPPGS
jgi:hypothetical protein